MIYKFLDADEKTTRIQNIDLLWEGGLLKSVKFDNNGECAKNGKQAYLETHSEKNVGIYRHFGFEAVSNDPIPGTEVTHWGMVK